MNTTSTFFLLLIISFLGSSCGNKNILVRNQVATQTTSGGQENNWTKKEAKKQISLKSLHVLIVDETNTQNSSPYQQPFSLRIHADEPIKADSVVESVYYNRILLSAFGKHLPQKANVRIIARKISPEALDSLVRIDKYDVVIAARKIRFDYQYFFVGMKAIDFEPNRGLMGVGVSIGVINKPSMMSTSVFENTFFSAQRPPIEGQVITYYSEWTLRRSSALGNNENTTINIKQEGIVMDYSNDDCELLFITTAQEAGESISQIFSW